MHTPIDRHFPLIVVSILTAACWIKAAEPPVRYVPTMGLQDIAIAAYDAAGPVVYFNPMITARVGPKVTAFIQMHEYAHHKLGHVRRVMFATNPYFRIAVSQQGEQEADKYAAEYWGRKDMSVVQAAVATFASPLTGNWGDATHLPTPIRAANIKRWADAVAQTKDDDSDSKSDAPTVAPEDKPFSHFIDLCKNGFEPVKGKRDPYGDSRSYLTTAEFPGASTTSIEKSPGEPEHLIAWFKRDSASEAKKAFEQLLKMAREDLGEKWEYDVSKTTTSRGSAFWRARISSISKKMKVEIGYIETGANTQRLSVKFSLH